MTNINRELQKKILEQLKELHYNESMNFNDLLDKNDVGNDDDKTLEIIDNLYYLKNYNLVDFNELHFRGTPVPNFIKITNGGLNFFEDDGGLASYLNHSKANQNQD